MTTTQNPTATATDLDQPVGPTDADLTDAEEVAIWERLEALKANGMAEPSDEAVEMLRKLPYIENETYREVWSWLGEA